MAGPISHIVITEKVFDKYFSKFNHREFILGTSFPDIRYLANVEREKTHPEGCSLENILEEKSSFEAGVKFHNFVDKKRINFISETPFVNKFVKIQPSQTAVKAAEDKKLYHKINNWEVITNYFETFPKDSLTYGVEREIIEKWFEIIQSYISNPVTINSVDNFMKELNYQKDKRRMVFESITNFTKATDGADFINKFYEEFHVN